MNNPIKFIGAALNTVSLAGKALGKAQKIFSALVEDKDKDGTPEYREALNGLMKVFHKIKDDSLPKLKVHLSEYESIWTEEIFPNAFYVFESARKAALEE